MARNLNRQIGTRSQRRKLYLYMEGKNTEPQYFKAYERFVVSARVELHLEKARGVPKTLFEHACNKKSEINSKKYKRENGGDDQVWIVFDRDEHDDVDEILKKCRFQGIETAFSSPCIEVWLILHFCNYDKDEHRKETQKYCEKVCLGYDSDGSKLPNMASLMPRVETAEKRAIALEKARDIDGGQAPLTTVYRLTQMIRSKN